MFTTSTKVRFSQVDPAGIVFYPRYFEMLNAAVEDWFEDPLGHSFASLHLDRKVGTPTVHLEVDFRAPSRLGETLDIAIAPLSLGKSSCRLAVTFTCQGEVRLAVEAVLVCMDLEKHTSMAWPTDLREAIAPQVAHA